jgi:hypothetical protein
MRRVACLLALGCLVLAPAAAAGAAPPVGNGVGGVGLSLVGEFSEPVGVAAAPGFPRLVFVVERAGRIRVVRRGVTLSRPFLDIEDLTTCATGCDVEQGLLGLDFPPDYGRSRRFYVFYTDPAGDIRIDEFRRVRRGSAVAIRSSRRPVLVVPHSDFANHNGGQIAFRGPHLYIATGDGGSAGDPFNNAQSRSSLLGKILRILPRRTRSGRPYGVPRANPFVNRPGRDEIFSYGLRNPYRFSIDNPPAGRDRIAIGDVGQSRYEEIDYTTIADANGANFGWDAFEGSALYDCGFFCPDDGTADPGGTVAPIFAYGHGSFATPGGPDGCSVIGGHVVRDRALRSLYGRYLYTDYCGGELRSLIPRLGIARDEKSTGLVASDASSFGEDTRGRTYVTSLEGPVYRLVPE